VLEMLPRAMAEIELPCQAISAPGLSNLMVSGSRDDAVES